MYEVELSHDRRADPSLQHYLETIGKHQLLSKDEEFELARRIREGDKIAFDRLVNANLRFVVSIAKQYLNRGLSYMDLIAEGNIGLITAARRFDERREFRFISYAVWWIRQSIQKAIADHTNTVRLPFNRMQQAQQMRRAGKKLEQIHHRHIRDEELAEAIGLSTRKLGQIRAASRPLVSMDYHANDEDTSLAETLIDPDESTPEQHFMQRELGQEIGKALELLDARERNIVILYYGLGDEESAPLEAIGQDIKLSRERVRQIRNQALAKIRETVQGERLVDFLN